MTAPVTVKNFTVKSHDAPDEVRAPNKTRVEVVKLDDYTIGRFNFEPGWRWSECVKPVAKTDQCQASHVGYAVAGSMIVQLTDGTKKTISAGDSYTIPPGHDAWVVGEVGFVGIEVMSAASYAKG